MKKTFFTGLSSLLLPLGFYGVPTQAAVGYQRSSYLSAGISTTATHVSMETFAETRELTMREAVVSDELDILSAVPVSELVVIDAAVPDKHILYRGIKPGVEVVELDANTAGLTQLTKLLARYKNLSAVHIVSHADEGVLLLGSSRITAEDIQQEMETLSALTGAVRDGGDLLFYGCNLAADQSGEALLDIIRDSTGLDVAASDDRTGNAALAGDWDLEIERGKIETELAFSQKALINFSGILAPTEYTALEIYNASYPAYWAQASLSSSDDKIIFSSPSGVVSAFNDGSTYGHIYASGGPPNYEQPRSVQIATDGTLAGTFELHELKICSWNATDSFGDITVNLTVTGYNASNTNIGSNNFSVTTKSCHNPTGGNFNDFDAIDLSGVFGSNFDLKRFVISYSTPPAGDEYFILKTVTLDDIQAPKPTVTSVSSISADGTYKIGDTVTVVVNFSEAVFLSTGTIQLTLETGTTDRVLNYLAGSGSATLYFSYTVQAGDTSADLDYTNTTALAANGDTIQNGSFIDANLTLPTPGAAGSLGANQDIVIDGVRPTASIVVADTALAVGETSTVTITFNEAVSGLSTADFTVANGALSGLSSGDGGITWTATLTPTASTTDASNLITLDNTGVSDAAGNAGTGTTDSNNYAIDTARPTASIVVADTALAVGETSLVTITFSEAVTGFTNADLTVANGTLSAVSSGDGGITWTATFTPTASVTDATNVITLANTGVADAAGNAGTGTTDSNNYAIDTARPTATVVVADNALAIGETSLVTFTFSEAVTGFTNADLAIANGTLSAVSSGDGGITWTATLTPTASITDATNLITLNNTGVTDAAGNAGTGSTDSNNYAIDGERPTASIVVDDTALAAGETSNVTITFNEAVSGLTTGDFTVANGALSSLSSGDGGITWTATLTPTASIEDPTNLITLDNTGVQDAAGNAGTGSTDSNNYAIDTLRPTAGIVVSDTALAAGETTNVTFTFSEAVSGLTTGDFTVASGAITGLSSGDGGITWTGTLTPTASVEDPSNLITLDNTGVTDAAGNTGSGTTDSNNYAIDTLRPSAAIVVADTALANGETTTVTTTFNEAITGLAIGDFTVGNGALSSLSSGDGGITWNATLTPSASSTGNVITLDNTGYVDAAGNTGTGTTDSNSYSVDIDAPVNSLPAAQITDSVTQLVFSSGNGNAISVADNGSLTVVISIGSGTLTASTGGSAGISNNGTGSVTITGTAAEVNVALEGLTYAPNGAGAQTFTIQSTDATGNVDSDNLDVTVNGSTLLVTSSLDTGDDETAAGSFAADQADGDGLSIREALSWGRAEDTITFDLDSGTAGNQGGSITLNGNQLVVAYSNLAIDGDLDGDGNADVIISGNNASRVLSVNASLSGIELSGLTLTQGNSIGGGGGLALGTSVSITVRDSNITNNTVSGTGGAGIYGNGVTLTVINSTVSGNTSDSFGGGIRVVGASVLNLINSTISGNTATGASQHGGGIQYAGSILTIVNSTISGNAVTGANADGGGLRITTGTSYIYNTTIVGNAATNVGGGVSANGTTDNFINTVVAGNTAGAGATAGTGGAPLATGGVDNDASGTIEVATNSFFGTTATITTDNSSLNNQGTTSLLLADLADNGGNGLTHRPQTGSALVDAGSTAALPADTYDLDGDTNVAEALPVDALGANRVSGAAVDIGAVEGNRAPELFDLIGGNTYVEGGVAVVIDSDVTVTDDELDELNGGNGNYNGASVTILRNGGVDASDTFGFLDGSGMSLVADEVIKNGQPIATFDTATAGQLVVTYTDANGELPERSDVNAIMQQITYASTSNDPDTSVVLDWTFTDEAGAPVTETASITISLKNDAPVVTATGGTPTFTESGTAVDLFSGVSIDPVEAAQSIIGLQLTVTGVNNGSDEILAIDGSDVALTQGNVLVTATNALNVSVVVAGTTATVTLSHATGITDATAQAVVDGMTYRNTSENPNPLSRAVTLSSVQDNGGVANDGADTTFLSTAATVTISAVNNAPTISGTPATATNQNALYSFTPSATDVDSDTLTFSIANQPAWASFNTETGTLSGVPSQANVGVTSNIVITVSDGDESTNLPAFSLTVADVNDAPVISGTPATSLDQDTTYLFTPTASDLDGDDLTFNIANQPAWASFDPATGTLAGTPDVDDVGIYPNIVITVSDGALTADLPSFSIEVLATNVAPEISGTPPLTAYVGAAYSFTPTASDADDDELTFSAMGLPTWLALDTATGQLSGTPAAADADMSYNIALSVSDGIETATLPVFSLSVEYDGAEPVVTPPEDITINAIGLYTPITLRQLLSLPPGTSAAAVQDALGDLASDSTGGEDCCVTQPQGLLANLILLPPGRHEIVWRATNPDGLTGEAVQVVNVRPRVAFGKHQVAVENTSVQVRVILNGRSPFYPLEVPYVIDPASTALLGIDHDAMDGSVTFTEGQTEVSFTVNLLAGGTAGDTRLIVRLDDNSPRSNEPIPNYNPTNPDIRDINAGAADQHFINIVEGNVIPKVNLVMNQSGADTILVGAGSGPVTATAVVTDPNPGDTHSFNWSATDSRLSDTDGSATNNAFVFDPAGQAGLRKLEVVTTDSAGGVDTSHLYFLIVPSLPALDAGTDTDEDGVDDLTEGTSDTNSNGIPDYLDNMPASNVLPQVIISTTSYLIECDPGVLCGIGQFALGGDSGGVQILNDELGVTEGLVADEDFEPAGGIFDFVIRDLPTAGQSVRIVIPQQAPIPANAVYRKFMGGEWVNFVENADNTLHSAPGNPGYCPPPGDETWAPGLVEGYLCVQLNIQDGGPNDADGVVNSAIADPGAVSSAKPVAPPPPPPPPPATSIDSKGGGALDWTWLLFGGVLLVLRRYGSKKPAVLLLVVALFSGASQAQPKAGDTYLRLSVYQAEGDQSAGDFSSAMANDGMAVSLRDYDESRVAYRLSVGYQWSEATSVELGYLDLGDVTVNFDTTVTDMAALTRALEEHYPMSADGFTLSHRFGHHFTSGLSLSGEVGIFMWDGKIDVDGAAIDPDLGSGIDPLVGVQLDYRLAEPVSLGLGYQRIFFDGQAVDLMGVSGIWHF